MGPKRYDSPNMSDTTLLVSVEDLINMAMGPDDVNVVNFKMIQTVLHILARQLRMLETQVEIKVSEVPPPREKKEKKKQPEPSSTESTSSKSPRKPSPPKVLLKGITDNKYKPVPRDKAQEREAKVATKERERAVKASLKDQERASRAVSKEREKAERAASKDKEKAERATSKERDKEERAASKEKEKAEKATLKDREKAERAATKDKEKAERATSKERDKAERASSKERDKADKAESKEREKAERAESKERDKSGRAESKEREKAERAQSKEREKADRAESKERDKADRASSKEREKAERAESKEREKSEKADIKSKEKEGRAESKDREKAEKEKEKLEKMDAKDREKAEKEKEKLSKMDAKEREKAEKEMEKLAKMDAKDREKAEKEKEKLSKMDAKEREKAEKEKEKLSKMDAKEREKAEKEMEKLAKMDAKDRERAEREQEKLSKMDAKEREKAEKEKEKLAKMDAKDREKAEKEKEKLAKMDAKDREKAEKEMEKLAKMDAKDREKAEKEMEKLAKMDAKDRERAEREQEKLSKMDAKEREKAEKEMEKLAKMNAKDREKAEREKEKLSKMDAKEREKAEKEMEKERERAEKAAAKEKEKLEKMSAKEREKYEKELAQEKAREEKERAKSAKAGISVKEKDKVLIVEKGPTTRPDSRTRVGSIEVVTISQFEMLEAAVKELKDKAGPVPFPALPDNEKLRSELAKGSASLTDTMQAMQVAARVQAAETAIGRMAGLLTQLAAAGALPQDVAGKLEDVKAEMDAVAEEVVKIRPSAGPPRKSVAIDPMSKKTSATSRIDARPSSVGSTAAPRPSVTSRASVASKVSSAPGVTHSELDNAIRSLKDDLTKNVNTLTAKATAAAETASATAKAVADKLDIALKLNTRISTLYSLVTDYAEQLNGFDAGLTTQMQSFQEQMVQMRNDLKGGITLLESANNNAETAAVMELNERYEGLVSDLDQTLHAHQALTAFQKQLGDELRSLLECVEMLREQKADRDEVVDGLRDKADNSRLAGLLTEGEFALSRAELERRLDLCYDKFRKQEQVWMGAIRDLTSISEGKAEIMQLLAARDDAQQQLRDIQDKLQKLAVILGEPKAAMLTRQLSKGARCGTCLLPALQEPTDISYGKPPPLPAVRPPPTGEEQPCMAEWRPPQPPDEREHTCHRWVGGSHTLLADSVVREQAGPLRVLGPPTKRYAGYGSDGRLYMMEEELKPCVECNMLSGDVDKMPGELKEVGPAAPPDGAGDTGIVETVVVLPP